MRKIFILSTLILLSMPFTMMAQSGKLKRAHETFENLNYLEAIQQYTKILEHSDDAKAKMNLAESFRLVGNTEEAEYWFGQVVLLPESEAIHKLKYGQMLQTNGKCDLAREWFQKYVEERPDDLRGQYLAQACNSEDELLTKNATIYEVDNVPFNTSLDDFSPIVYDDGIVFSSEYQAPGSAIKRSHAWTGKPFLELFYVKRKKKRKGSRGKEFNYEYGKSGSFSSKLNTKYHDASITFSSDDSEVYFTRNNYNNGKTGRDDEGDIRLKIYSAKNNGKGAWSEVEGLPFNSNEYSVAHPALSADGMKLYFASDMPGGFGGMDLYVTEQDNGRWGPPMNLGPSVNTEGNEVFPYIAPNGHLYFASDGRVGLGGLDIYTTTILDGFQYSEITNVGAPINSISDDFGIVMHEDGRFGYFSSDREGGKGGDDIYSFTKLAAPVRLFVYDETTGEGLQNAKVVNETTGATYMTDAKGIVIVDQKIDACCTYAAASGEYIANSKQGCTKDLKKGENVIVEIPLKKPLEFMIHGVVMDQVTKKPVKGAKVELVSTCEGVDVLTAISNYNGEYRFNALPDCCYEIKTANNKNYLPFISKERCTKGLTKSTKIKQDLALKLLPPPVKPSAGVIAGTTRPSSRPATTYRPTTSTTTTRPSNTYRPTTSARPSQATTQVASTSSTYVAPSYTGTTSTTSSYPSTNGGKTTLSHFGEGRTPGTYLIHIYYDFDQSYIRKDAKDELTKLYQLLMDNPQYVVEVGSHTDSRGSNAYNYRLSQRRAEAVVRWLKDKGVSSARMKPKGYGETVNVNHCSNNVPCSEEEHQWNRRTEFKIIGNIDAQGQVSNVVKSAKPSNIKVDSCQGCPF